MSPDLAIFVLLNFSAMPTQNLPMLEDAGTSEDSVATRETPFSPRSDDEDTLWAVHAITQESDTQYKVRWVGTDPRTGKPWPQGWVPKSDCTDHLVAKWDAKMKSKREGAHESGRDSGVFPFHEDVAEGTDVSHSQKV